MALFEQRRSISNLSTVFCRICHDGDSKEELIDPCECSGSVAFVHVSCLEKWLSTSNTQHCDICNYEFLIQKRNKPFTHESFRKWFYSMLNDNPRIMVSDILAFLCLTPLCIAATYLCGFGAFIYGRRKLLESVGLIGLNTILLATYCAWLIITIRFHIKMWHNWCKQDQEVKLLINRRPNDPESRNNSNTNSVLYLDENVTNRSEDPSTDETSVNSHVEC